MEVAESTVGGRVVLRRRVTLLNGVSLIVGSIIGSGVFVSPGGVLQYAGSPAAALAIWAFCGVFCTLGALCFSELGTMLPAAGGEYAYILSAFGGLPAFLTLWVNVLVIRPAAQAVVSLTFAEYALALTFPDCDPPRGAITILAATALCTLTFINCVSVRLSMRIQTVFTGAKLLALFIIIVAGLLHLCWGKTELLERAGEGQHNLGGVALALYSGLFAYGGWNYLNFVTEELKDPHRNLPRAIWVALPLVTTVYVLVNVAYLAVLPPSHILSSNAVAVAFGSEVLGPLKYTMPVFVALSTFGSLNGILFTSGRLFLAGAREGHLPPVLSYIHVHSCTPVPALLVTCVLSLAMLGADIISLINCLSFVLWLSIGAAVAALLWLRRTRPNLHRPIRVHTVLPLVFLAGCIYLVVVPMITEPISTGIGILITLSGIPVYVAAVWKSKPDWFNTFHDEVTFQLQRLLLVVGS
ncbi:LOW QUALITY PROTEIN: large neutral amino acids transporter small subunit 1 [Procambarus clarkii]|uniref:LOW QUALITY PROTEIN: large neutral amino acids transporter small subunit 1 n=1 Tax=Procambarus clarkii TaxID=6728 RepID=UPI0037422592